MKLVSNRNFTLRTTTGHIIKFVKDTPVDVPPSCVAHAMQVGCVPHDGVAPESPEEKAAAVIPVGIHRIDAIVDAIEALVARNARADFTASGMPQVKSIEKILGYDIDSKERNECWVEYQQRLAEKLENS